jgi:hypothetical protein
LFSFADSSKLLFNAFWESLKWGSMRNGKKEWSN